MSRKVCYEPNAHQCPKYEANRSACATCSDYKDIAENNVTNYMSYELYCVEVEMIPYYTMLTGSEREQISANYVRHCREHNIKYDEDYDMYYDLYYGDGSDV